MRRVIARAEIGQIQTKEPIWIPLKTRNFDGQAVSLTAQMPDSAVKYLRNAETPTASPRRSTRRMQK
jgi:hypothetical protein